MPLSTVIERASRAAQADAAAHTAAAAAAAAADDGFGMIVPGRELLELAQKLGQRLASLEEAVAQREQLLAVYQTRHVDVERATEKLAKAKVAAAEQQAQGVGKHCSL